MFGVIKIMDFNRTMGNAPYIHSRLDLILKLSQTFPVDVFVYNIGPD